MRNFHIKLTVLISIVLIFIVLNSPTSCERLGVEVTTVKGVWKSEDYNNQDLILNLSDNGMSYQTRHNDSVILNRKGTWSLHNDTLRLFYQDLHADGLRILKIEQMSMNTLTLRSLKSENIYIMTRLYSTANKDYNSQLNEVFYLKRGFWWYAFYIISLVICVLLLVILVERLQALIKWILRKIKK